MKTRLMSSSATREVCSGNLENWLYNNYAFSALGLAVERANSCTMDELLAVFNRYGDRVHVEELHNGEFDWLISFEDGQPDAYRYCIADEGCHLTYHRFTKEDYEAFGF